MSEESPSALIERFNSNESLPYPVVLEFAKCTSADSAGWIAMERLLSILGRRFGSSPGFWKMGREPILDLFTIADGSWYLYTPKEQKTDELQEPTVIVASLPIHVAKSESNAASALTGSQSPEYESDSDSDSNTTDTSKPSRKKKDMRDYFAHGTNIRHTGSLKTSWVGIFDADDNVIRYDGRQYASPSAFATDHYVRHGMSRNGSGWIECEFYSDRHTWKKLNTVCKRD